MVSYSGWWNRSDSSRINHLLPLRKQLARSRRKLTFGSTPELFSDQLHVSPKDFRTTQTMFVQNPWPNERTITQARPNEQAEWALTDLGHEYECKVRRPKVYRKENAKRYGAKRRNIDRTSKGQVLSRGGCKKARTKWNDKANGDVHRWISKTIRTTAHLKAYFLYSINHVTRTVIDNPSLYLSSAFDSLT